VHGSIRAGLCAKAAVHGSIRFVLCAKAAVHGSIRFVLCAKAAVHGSIRVVLYAKAAVHGSIRAGGARRGLGDRRSGSAPTKGPGRVPPLACCPRPASASTTIQPLSCVASPSAGAILGEMLAGMGLELGETFVLGRAWQLDEV
jgi:hypothetical protein